jgi:hypothetical protein
LGTPQVIDGGDDHDVVHGADKLKARTMVRIQYVRPDGTPTSETLVAGHVGEAMLAALLKLEDVRLAFDQNRARWIKDEAANITTLQIESP